METKTPEKVELKNWNDVDQALRLLGENQINIEKVEGKMNEAIIKAKETAERKAAPLRTENKSLEAAIETFCRANKNEFAKRRRRDLTFGSVAMRITTKIVTPAAEVVLKSLKVLGLLDCITIKETVNKKELGKLEDASLLRLGARREKEDSFRIEPDLERLREDLGA